MNWLLLIHQIPPKPDYFRVKIWRKLQKIGAVAVKQSVYVLPDTEQAFEDLHWVVKEIDGGGGTASLSRAVFLEGLTDTQIQEIFIAARESDYTAIAEEAEALFSQASHAISLNDIAVVTQLQKDLNRLMRRYDEIVSLDFFHAPGQAHARDILDQCRQCFISEKDTPVTVNRDGLIGKVWVTRENLFVDRVCCVWLIKRFIDAQAEFKFVADEQYSPLKGEIRFDMFDAEFTHQGDKCSFEVLIASVGLCKPGLSILAEIVHDIDLKDNKFSRPETAGIQALFFGALKECENDQQRICQAMSILDGLYVYLKESVAVK
jgi:hypothetical protein